MDAVQAKPKKDLPLLAGIVAALVAVGLGAFVSMLLPTKTSWVPPVWHALGFTVICVEAVLYGLVALAMGARRVHVLFGAVLVGLLARALTAAAAAFWTTRGAGLPRSFLDFYLVNPRMVGVQAAFALLAMNFLKEHLIAIAPARPRAAAPEAPVEAARPAEAIPAPPPPVAPPPPRVPPPPAARVVLPPPQPDVAESLAPFQVEAEPAPAEEPTVAEAPPAPPPEPIAVGLPPLDAKGPPPEMIAEVVREAAAEVVAEPIVPPPPPPEPAVRPPVERPPAAPLVAEEPTDEASVQARMDKLVSELMAGVGEVEFGPEAAVAEEEPLFSFEAPAKPPPVAAPLPPAEALPTVVREEAPPPPPEVVPVVPVAPEAPVEPAVIVGPSFSFELEAPPAPPVEAPPAPPVPQPAAPPAWVPPAPPVAAPTPPAAAVAPPPAVAAPPGPPEAEVDTIYVAAEDVLAQLPPGALNPGAADMETAFAQLRFAIPVAQILPQLPEGEIRVPVRMIVKQMPRGSLAVSDVELEAALVDGIELPLAEVVPQVPRWHLALLGTKRPAPKLDEQPIFQVDEEIAFDSTVRAVEPPTEVAAAPPPPAPAPVVAPPPAPAVPTVAPLAADVGAVRRLVESSSSQFAPVQVDCGELEGIGYVVSALPPTANAAEARQRVSTAWHDLRGLAAAAGRGRLAAVQVSGQAGAASLNLSTEPAGVLCQVAATGRANLGMLGFAAKKTLRGLPATGLVVEPPAAPSEGGPSMGTPTVRDEGATVAVQRAAAAVGMPGMASSEVVCEDGWRAIVIVPPGTQAVALAAWARSALASLSAYAAAVGLGDLTWTVLEADGGALAVAPGARVVVLVPARETGAGMLSVLVARAAAQGSAGGS